VALPDNAFPNHLSFDTEAGIFHAYSVLDACFILLVSTSDVFSTLVPVSSAVVWVRMLQLLSLPWLPSLAFQNAA